MNTRDPGHERPHDPDPALVRRARAGQRAAQDALARELWPRMRRWAFLELADAAAADDACQEALVRMLRHLHRYDPDRGSFVGWMRTITRNAARDQRRGRGPEVDGVVVPLDRSVDLRRSAGRALDALRCLTPKQRHAIDLCDWQGLSAVDAARCMDCTPGTVRVHLHDARKRLREELGGEVHALVKENR